MEIAGRHHMQPGADHLPGRELYDVTECLPAPEWQRIFEKRAYDISSGCHWVVPAYCRRTETNHQGAGAATFQIFGQRRLLFSGSL